MSYYLVFGLALAVGGVGCFLRSRSPALGKSLILCGCIALLVCLGWQLRQNVFSPTPSGPDRGQAVVGYYLANQVLTEVESEQGRIVLLFPPDTVIDAETAGTSAGTFTRVLRSTPGLKVEVRTLSVPYKAAQRGEIPLASFQQVTSNASAFVACVSFAGVPANIEGLQPGHQQAPAFFVFDPWSTTNWLGALKKGIIRCVIVPRPGVRHGAGDNVSGEPGEVFRQLYLLATPKTADQIAAQLGVK